MDINGISSYAANVTNGGKTDTSKKGSSKVAEETTKTEETGKDTAVVYESSTQETTKTEKKYTQNTELINKLKADQEQRASQLKSLVETLIGKQGLTFANANVFTSDFWKQFNENGGTVDEATKKQAQEDISEDGYWGVKQTSERILDFAKALCGGDPDKIDEMEAAFEKGYKEATKAWGDELPSLCADTYKAVKEGFDKWRAEANGETVEETTKTE